MERGLPMEPHPAIGQRLRALPYFIHNLFPGLRQSWIRISRRDPVGNATVSDLPRLRPDQTIAESFERETAPLAAVLDDSGVLIGAIEFKRAGELARDAMNPAPQTIRPDMTRRLAASLLRHSPYLLVTDTNGRYLGRYMV